jgi:hypothetical protein
VLLVFPEHLEYLGNLEHQRHPELLEHLEDLLAVQR